MVCNPFFAICSHRNRFGVFFVKRKRYSINGVLYFWKCPRADLADIVAHKEWRLVIPYDVPGSTFWISSIPIVGNYWFFYRSGLMAVPGNGTIVMKDLERPAVVDHWWWERL